MCQSGCFSFTATKLVWDTVINIPHFSFMLSNRQCFYCCCIYHRELNLGHYVGVIIINSLREIFSQFLSRDFVSCHLSLRLCHHHYLHPTFFSVTFANKFYSGLSYRRNESSRKFWHSHNIKLSKFNEHWTVLGYQLEWMFVCSAGVRVCICMYVGSRM